MAKMTGPGGGAAPASAGMVVIRLFLGAYFLYSGIVFAGDMPGFIHFMKIATSDRGLFITQNPCPAFAHWLIAAVAPHVSLTCGLLVGGELLAGVLLLVGLLTRLGALIAMTISLFFLLATLADSAPSTGANSALLVMSVAVLIAAAGRTWGLDAILVRRTRIKLLW